MSNTPSKNKNVFENYYDHLKIVHQNYLNTKNQLLDQKGIGQAIAFMDKTAGQRMNFFQPLRDRYDYADEVMGVLSTPVVLLASLTSVMKSMYHGVAALMVSMGCMKASQKEKPHLAKHNLIEACISLLVAINNCLISAVSLITRPIVTKVYGFAAQDTTRRFDSQTSPQP